MHYFRILNHETGDGDLDPSLESVLEYMMESFTVSNNKQKKNFDDPYLVSFICPKDRNVPGKQCNKKISVSVVVEALSLATESIASKNKSRLFALKRRFEERIMEKLLSFDRKVVNAKLEKGQSRVYAQYTQCPRTGCSNCNGFRCDPNSRRQPNGQVGKIVSCPDINCMEWWCSSVTPSTSRTRLVSQGTHV